MIRKYFLNVDISPEDGEKFDEDDLAEGVRDYLDRLRVEAAVEVVKRVRLR